MDINFSTFPEQIQDMCSDFPHSTEKEKKEVETKYIFYSSWSLGLAPLPQGFLRERKRQMESHWPEVAKGGQCSKKKVKNKYKAGNISQMHSLCPYSLLPLRGACISLVTILPLQVFLFIQGMTRRHVWGGGETCPRVCPVQFSLPWGVYERYVQVQLALHQQMGSVAFKVSCNESLGQMRSFS